MLLTNLRLAHIPNFGCAKPTSTHHTTASWYGKEEKETANGEKYKPLNLTAANWNLPFNTYVLVTNLKTASQAIVRITDRGPRKDLYQHGRQLDVSQGAARQLGFEDEGLTKVMYQPLE
jgi:rare lipoprotein A